MSLFFMGNYTNTAATRHVPYAVVGPGVATVALVRRAYFPVAAPLTTIVAAAANLSRP